MAVPLVDKEEYREVLADSLEEQIQRQSSSLIREMSAALKANRKITDGRQRDFVERVRGLSAMVSEYEALLEREIEGAKSDLELAHREAMALLEHVEVK